MMKIALFIIYIICSVAGVIFMKYGGTSNVTSYFVMGIKLNVFSLAGIFLYGIGFLLWMYLVQKFDLSKIVPFVMAIYNTMIVLLSVLIFGEKLSFINCIGIAAIIIGVVIINL